MFMTIVLNVTLGYDMDACERQYSGCVVGTTGNGSCLLIVVVDTPYDLAVEEAVVFLIGVQPAA